mmetsp:Transcript_6122/g.13342  ORF Transcript_6122/g.13342 Transcript_6122/m.13342 type:complete len:94 (-) Transcript_6122:554-835(-)
MSLFLNEFQSNTTDPHEMVCLNSTENLQFSPKANVRYLSLSHCACFYCGGKRMNSDYAKIISSMMSNATGRNATAISVINSPSAECTAEGSAM